MIECVKGSYLFQRGVFVPESIFAQPKFSTIQLTHTY